MSFLIESDGIKMYVNKTIRPLSPQTNGPKSQHQSLLTINLPPEPYQIHSKMIAKRSSYSCPHLYHHLSSQYLKVYEKPTYINQKQINSEPSVYPIDPVKPFNDPLNINFVNMVGKEHPNVERAIKRFSPISRDRVFEIPEDSKVKDISFPRITDITTPDKNKRMSTELDKSINSHYNNKMIRSENSNSLKNISDVVIQKQQQPVLQYDKLYEELQATHTTKKIIPCSVPLSNHHHNKKKSFLQKYYLPPPKHPKEFPPKKQINNDCNKFGLKGGIAFRPNSIKVKKNVFIINSE